MTKGPVLLAFIKPDVRQVLTRPGRGGRGEGGRDGGWRRTGRRSDSMVTTIRHVDVSIDVFVLFCKGCVSIVVYCSLGNQLVPSPTFSFGQR